MFNPSKSNVLSSTPTTSSHYAYKGSQWPSALFRLVLSEMGLGVKFRGMTVSSWALSSGLYLAQINTLDLAK